MRRLLLPSLVVLAILLLWLEPFATHLRDLPPSRVVVAESASVPSTYVSAATQPNSAVSAPKLYTTAPSTAPSVAAIPTTHPVAMPPTNPDIQLISLQPSPGEHNAKPAPVTIPPIPQARPTPQPVLASDFSWDTIHGMQGFWRIGKTDRGVWWFVSPDNRVEFLNTVTTVQPYQLAHDPHGTIFLSRDYDGTPNSPTDLHPWAQRTLQRVLATGFKGLGAWCHPVFHDLPVPITQDLNVWASAPADSGRLYDPGWLPAAENLIKNTVTPLKSNKYLVGYYLDNEINFSDACIGPGLYFDNLPSDNPNRQKVVTTIKKLWPDVNQFNVAWGFAFKDYSELDTLKALPKDPPETYSYLMSAWLEQLMHDYFQTATALVHKYDPNHLILGIRYAGYAPPEAIRASKGLTDAQSLNYYVSDALLDPQLFNSMHDLSDQPMIISEYSFHALDGRSGNRNSVGFAAQVMDQQARADAYKGFTTRVARLPWIIGADWFQWADEPPSGRGADGEDVNFGVVDIDDREYSQMVDAVRTTSPRLNPLHNASWHDEGKGIWREDFVALPTQRVPYLPIPIRINGELSDWPGTARLRDMHLTHTVGLERSVLPPPNVYLGWRPEGLYIGLEVFDTDPVAAPITGRWWTRDMVEMWISTRPVTTDVQGYNQYCHQFIFLPTDGAINNGVAGAVGQWHRPGDALKDSLLPHPEIQYNTRILADRYVAEMFIPASSLHGWDPVNHPQMTFNIHVRNYQHAVAYFWSAPKEVQTQVRPKTWGTILLDPNPSAKDRNQVDSYNNARWTLGLR